MVSVHCRVSVHFGIDCLSDVTCLYFLDAGNDVAEYYQQQVEMLESFDEMDVLADRGYIPGMTKACFSSFSVLAFYRLIVCHAAVNHYILFGQ